MRLINGMNLSNLKILYSSNNKINYLPDSISNLNRLSKLWINSNQLSSLPSSLCKLSNNCDIKVSYNCLPEEYHYNCLEDIGKHMGYWCK